MKFTKLNIGNTVVTSGNKCFKKLTTEEQSTKESIVGTWTINAHPASDVSFRLRGELGYFYAVRNSGIYGTYYDNVSLDRFEVISSEGGASCSIDMVHYVKDSSDYGRIIVYNDPNIYGGEDNIWGYQNSSEPGENSFTVPYGYLDDTTRSRTVTFTRDTENENVIAWLKANAVRQ